jgi:group I intron endonuclease
MATIYKITHLASGRCYVGHTSDTFKKRVYNHRYELNRLKHANARLQNAWTKYGSDAFLFEILEQCDEEQKLIREQHYIDAISPFYNIALVAGSRKGVPQPPHVAEIVRLANLGRKHTEKSRQLIGQASKEWWTNNDQTPAQRIGTVESLKIARAKSKANKPGWVPTHRIGVKDSAATIEKRRESRLRTKPFRPKRCWITDGALEQQIEMLATIPEGWRRGRQPKIGEVGKSRVGEKRSDEARAKMSAAHKRRYAEMAKCE